MHTLAKLHILFPAQYIHTETRSNGGQSRIGTGETCRHNANGKQDYHQVSHRPRSRKHRQQIIRSIRQSHSLFLSQHHQQHTQTQEKQIGRHKGKTIAANILLGLTERLAGKILLHHVLIKTSHHNHYKDTAEELFPEILFRHPVIKDKNTGMTVVSNRSDRFGRSHAQRRHHLTDNEDERSKHTERLKGIRPHQRLDATLARIKPDKQYHDRNRDPERNTNPIEHETLQEDTDDKETDRRTRHLGQEEERSSSLIRTFPQPLLQITVNRSEIIPVIDRKQKKGNQEITQDETDAHLKVGHIRSHHHARHTDKSDARNRRTHHTESNHIPRRTAVGTIESFITCHFTGSKMTEEQQHTEVCQNCDNDSHILLNL